MASNVGITRAWAIVLGLLVASAVEAAQPTETCGVTDTLLKSGFEAGEIGAASISPGGTAPSLSVALPLDGSTVGTSTVRVSGTFTGPSNTGISVNGSPAANTLDGFVSSAIRLQPGPNQLNVTLTTQDGTTITTPRNVTYDASAAPEVSLNASVVSDLVPLGVVFSVIPKVGSVLTVVRIRIDYDGDGQVDLDTTNVATTLAYTYLQPGLYPASATVTLDDGDPMTPTIDVVASAPVLAVHPGFVRYTLCQAFADMRARLVSENVTLAVKPLHPDIRGDFQPFWNGLVGMGLSTVAAGLGTIVNGTFSNTTGELLLARPVSGNPGNFNGFRVQFERDRDAVWRITAM